MRDLATLSVRQEHQFWLEILEDHAVFVFEALSPAETTYTAEAARFQRELSGLRARLARIPASAEPDSPEMVAFANDAAIAASAYARFEGKLQALRLVDQVELQLSPTYLNGTISEELEYVRLLSFFTKGRVAEPLSFAALVDLWLEDQLGHCVLLMNVLDPAEALLRGQTEQFLQKFNALTVKHTQMKRYLRVLNPGFPAQTEYAAELYAVVNDFAAFVQAVVDRMRKHALLSRTTLRFLDHHFPETCYFLLKLRGYAPELPPVRCSLTKLFVT